MGNEKITEDTPTTNQLRTLLRGWRRLAELPTLCGFISVRSARKL